MILGGFPGGKAEYSAKPSLYKGFRPLRVTTVMRFLRQWRTSPRSPPVQMQPLFHLAFPVHDLAAARRFYGDLLGCPEGRSSDAWVDFNFYGHQVVAHLSPEEAGHRRTSAVDGDDVPVRHFGAILPMAEWEALAARLKAAETRFIIEP